MSKSRFVFDKLAKLIEQGFINYKDFSNELMNILNSKRDEIIFKMKIAEKEEINVIGKRLEKIGSPDKKTWTTYVSRYTGTTFDALNTALNVTEC